MRLSGKHHNVGIQVVIIITKASNRRTARDLSDRINYSLGIFHPKTLKKVQQKPRVKETTVLTRFQRCVKPPTHYRLVRLRQRRHY